MEKSHSLALALTLTVTLSLNHSATRHCWLRWCTALPLTHQPTLQYNITQRKGRKLHDVKITYSKEWYKNNPINDMILESITLHHLREWIVVGVCTCIHFNFLCRFDFDFSMFQSCYTLAWCQNHCCGYSLHGQGINAFTVLHFYFQRPFALYIPSVGW